MDIKQYDIVEFRGNPCRVMYISHEDNDLQISPYGWVPQSNVKLLESTHIPTLNIGDEVIIHEIDDGDQNIILPTGWMVWTNLSVLHLLL